MHSVQWQIRCFPSQVAVACDSVVILLRWFRQWLSGILAGLVGAVMMGVYWQGA